jgi:hypothetical protein
MTDKTKIAQGTVEVNNKANQAVSNVISFMMESGKGLYFSNPYELALYIQQKEKERKGAREQARYDSPFLADWPDDWDPDAA